MTVSFTPEQLERIKLWEQELLNPDRNQGTGRLAYTEFEVDKFCCLGIACEVAIANGLEVNRTKIEGAGCDNKIIHQYDGNADHLPPSVAAWYGFDRVTREFYNPTLHYIDPEGQETVASAADFNDGDAGLDERLTFQEIAAAIRYTYLEGGYEEDPDPVEAVNFDTQAQA